MSPGRRVIQTVDIIFSSAGILLVYLYRYFLSPFFPPSCRFYPSCSLYSIEAFKKHGFLKGLFLSGRRIVKCNPFHPGGIDPVPELFHFFK